MTRVGLFLPNWIGDVCMATPTIRAISEHLRAARKPGESVEVIGIMRPYVSYVLEGTDWFHETWFCEKKPHHPEHRASHLLRRMRAKPLDALVLMPNSLRTAALSYFGGARRRIGYASDGRGWMLTDVVPEAAEPLPLVYRLLKLVRPLGFTATDPRTELRTTAVDEERADLVWRNLRLRPGEHVVTMNCGSAGAPSRRWPAERFGLLAQRIAGELGRDVLVLCGPGEQELAESIRRHACHPRVVSMAEQPLDLGTAKACIRRASMMVSTDSGPKHIAVAFDRPVVTLHGPVSPLETANPTARATPVMLNLSCIDCRRNVCPLKHHQCMQDLTVGYVFSRVVETMQREHRRIAA
ncbi:MAG: glycosyltransferase family 9 protein [Planctomycetales bacterium]|nr:glycosyltransferase family 9 protein [Planctomycetales bacterium]